MEQMEQIKEEINPVDEQIEDKKKYPKYQDVKQREIYEIAINMHKALAAAEDKNERDKEREKYINQILEVVGNKKGADDADKADEEIKNVQ